MREKCDCFTPVQPHEATPGKPRWIELSKRYYSIKYHLSTRNLIEMCFDRMISKVRGNEN